MRLDRRFIVITVLAVVAMGVTASLGAWQLRRAALKQDLAAAQQARWALPELDGASLQATDDAATTALINRRVRLRGQWLHAHSVWLDNRQMQGRVGLYLLTPLQLQGSPTAVLVQRGWVPRNFEDRSRLPDVPQDSAEVEVHGRIALSPSKLYELGQGAQGPIRQNIDLAAFAAETGLPLATVSVVQTDASDAALKRDWPAVDAGIDKHHGYAFQWFGLCALIAILYVWFQIVRRPR